MMRNNGKTLLAALTAAILALTLGACDISNSERRQDDQALWEKIIWSGAFANARYDAEVVMTLDVTGIAPGSGCSTYWKIDPGFQEAFVTYSYETMPWRAGDPKQGADGVLQNFFIWDEAAKAYKGGVFEWWEPRIGVICGMINAQDGFNNLHAPCSGTKVAFAWTNFAGTQRSNLVETVWP